MASNMFLKIGLVQGCLFNNNNLFLRSSQTPSWCIRSTPLFVGQGNPSAWIDFFGLHKYTYPISSRFELVTCNQETHVLRRC